MRKPNPKFSSGLHGHIVACRCISYKTAAEEEMQPASGHPRETACFITRFALWYLQHCFGAQSSAAISDSKHVASVGHTICHSNTETWLYFQIITDKKVQKREMMMLLRFSGTTYENKWQARPQSASHSSIPVLLKGNIMKGMYVHTLKVSNNHINVCYGLDIKWPQRCLC